MHVFTVLYLVPKKGVLQGVGQLQWTLYETRDM